ncbi:MAG: hypothetical protein K2X39_10040 [Silvanigrellaceae bacterium]|nr:hypothetical protein [Silvanigrellaceae bacterium]
MKQDAEKRFKSKKITSFTMNAIENIEQNVHNINKELYLYNKGHHEFKQSILNKLDTVLTNYIDPNTILLPIN